MLFFVELWRPIVVSACTVSVLSALMWMVLRLHRSEWRHLPTQADVQQAMRGTPLPPGRYMLPYWVGQDLGRADMRASLEQGPVAYIDVAPNGVPSVPARLVLNFVFFLGVSTVVAYATWHGFTTQASGLRSMPLGVPSTHTARVVFAIAMLAYSASAFQESVWFGRPWKSFVLTVVDAVVYSAATAAIFGWLWPV